MTGNAPAKLRARTGQERTFDWMSTDAKMLPGATARDSPVHTMDMTCGGRLSQLIP